MAGDEGAGVMSTFIIALAVFCAAGMSFCAYMLFRNGRVYRYRVWLLENNRASYARLPEYDLMLNKFWVWPLSRFLPKEAGTP